MKCPICKTEIRLSAAGYAHPDGCMVMMGSYSRPCEFNGEIANEKMWSFAARAIMTMGSIIFRTEPDQEPPGDG